MVTGNLTVLSSQYRKVNTVRSSVFRLLGFIAFSTQKLRTGKPDPVLWNEAWGTELGIPRWGLPTADSQRQTLKSSWQEEDCSEAKAPTVSCNRWN